MKKHSGWWSVALMALAAAFVAGTMPPPVEAARTVKLVTSAPVNVNTAGVDELVSLPGIGPALAARIVEHRKAQGAFRKPEDLLAVKGIGAKLLGRIKDRLVFDGVPEKR